MPPTGNQPDSPQTGRLDDRVLGAIKGIRGRVAFNGLRRALRAHPESLSRALRRLEREGLVERGTGGYRSLVLPPPRPRLPRTERRPIARIDLPPGSSPDELVRRLMGRWFGALRWVGATEGESRRLLAWAHRDGTSNVWLEIDAGSMRVYVAEGVAGGDPAEAEEAAYELLYHAVEALRAPPDAGMNGARYLLLRGEPSVGFLDEN